MIYLEGPVCLERMKNAWTGMYSKECVESIFQPGQFTELCEDVPVVYLEGNDLFTIGSGGETAVKYRMIRSMFFLVA